MEKLIHRYYPCTTCNKNTSHKLQKQSQDLFDVQVKIQCQVHKGNETIISIPKGTWMGVLNNQYKPIGK